MHAERDVGGLRGLVPSRRGVTAVEGPWLYTMRCVDPGPAGTRPAVVRRVLERRVGLGYRDRSGQPWTDLLVHLGVPSDGERLTDRHEPEFRLFRQQFFLLESRREPATTSWTGERIAAGSHSIRVSPSSRRRGDYTIMAVVYCPPGHCSWSGSCVGPPAGPSARYVVPTGELRLLLRTTGRLARRPRSRPRPERARLATPEPPPSSPVSPSSPAPAPRPGRDGRRPGGRGTRRSCRRSRSRLRRRSR